MTLNCFSQIIFEKGYFIDNTGEKTECLIKNYDWKKNPTEFEYKISESAEEKIADLKSIQEFRIYKSSKYIRSTVQLDVSSENISNLSTEKSPVFKEETVFLEALIEGKANLYSYENTNVKRYFYSTENSDINQLIFKSYKTGDGKIAKNNRFRNQLWNDLKCNTISLKNVENLNYTKNSLVNFFVKYNECNNAKMVNYAKDKKEDFFNLTLRPRLSNSSLTLGNTEFQLNDADFGSKITFGFGVEAEYILPFNKNKWSIAIEPTYQYFNGESSVDKNTVQGGKLISHVEYSSIEFPLSLRHYFFINENSKIFVNASYIIDASLNSTIVFERADGSNLNSYDLSSRTNVGLGVGYKMYDKVSLEFRYQTTRDVLGDYTFFNSSYNTVSMILGYSLF